ncbi:MAG: DMT family transporter [Anaerolineaceae bacterium]
MKNNDKTYMGYITVLLWSMASAFVRSLSEVIGPFTSSFFVYIIGGLLTLLLAPKKERKNPALKDLSKPAILSGVIYIIFVFTTYYSIAISKTREISLGVTVVKSLWPLFTLILSIPMLQEKKKLSLPGLLFSLSGVLVVVLGGSKQNVSYSSPFQLVDLIPFILGFISAISWGLYSNIVKKYDVDGSIVGVFMVISGLIMGLISLFVVEPADWSLSVIGQILYAAVISIYLATYFWNQSILKGDIHKVTLAANYVPLLSVLVSSLILNVKIDLSILIGGALLVIGNFYHRKMEKNTKEVLDG